MLSTNWMSTVILSSILATAHVGGRWGYYRVRYTGSSAASNNNNNMIIIAQKIYVNKSLDSERKKINCVLQKMHVQNTCVKPTNKPLHCKNQHHDMELQMLSLSAQLYSVIASVISSFA